MRPLASRMMLFAVVFSVAWASVVGIGQAATRTVFKTPISLYGGTAAGLAVDEDDNLYIAENANNQGIRPRGPFVSKVGPDGIRTFFVSPGILGDVTALAFDGDGNLYVADGNGNGNGQPHPRNKVWKVTPSGEITTFIPWVNNPTGLAFDSQGNLYVSSFGDNAVYQYSPSGVLLGVVASSFYARPYGIAIDGQDNLYVGAFAGNSGAGGRRIYKVTPSGQISVFVDPGFPDPHSLVFGPAGDLWASY